MKLSGLSQKIFLDRYSLKDAEGLPIETEPEQMWRRVARGIATQEKKGVREKWEKKFYDVLKDFKFVPGGRILSGAGTDYKVTYFNCFVIPSPHDSRQGILESLNQLVEIQARSGGVGLNLSSLRPRGARVKTVNGTSSGPVTWAGLFSYATHDVVQQGGTRRGATMLMLWDWHPDIEEFITVKQDLTKIHGANLSVCVSDSFMEAVKADADWDLLYPDINDPKYDKEWTGDMNEWKKLGGKTVVYKTVKAKYLWDMICQAAWRSAEPGLHFLERSNKRSNTWYFENLVATNPCGEQPLGGWAVCNLGAMNLSAYVTRGVFDYDSFGEDVRTSMRFLDNVIDDTFYFYEENKKCAKDIRRTGLGIMGIADALIKMKIRYGSDESRDVVGKIFKTLRDSAYDASAMIAKEKGAFPKFDKEKYMEGFHIKALPAPIQKKIEKFGIRNAVLLTIAPTGTTSILADVSSGVEPVYEFSFKRRWRGGEEIVYHPLFDAWRKKNPDAEKPDYFASANDLTPEDHVKIQAVAQEYIDSSISKTVNAPNDHTVEDVKRLYMMAYDQGLKGITYMRDGSRQGVLERTDSAPKAEDSGAAAISGGAQEVPTGPTTPTAPGVQPMELPAPAPVQKIIPRPMVAYGSTYRINTPVGTAYITINGDANDEPLEVFINGVGKAGSDLFAMAEGLGRVISLMLRISSPLSRDEKMRKVVDELMNIGGSSVQGFGKFQVRSLPDAVAKALCMKYGLHGFSREDHPHQQPDNAPAPAEHVTNGANGLSEQPKTNGHASPAITEALMKDTVTQGHTPVASYAVAPDMFTADTGEAKTKLDICPECGSASLVYEEGCKKCYSCGTSAC